MGRGFLDLLNKLVPARMQISEKTPREDNALGFQGRFLTFVSLPYRNPNTDTWIKSGGNVSLTIRSHVYEDENGKRHDLGIPFGVLPRILFLWLATEAVKKQTPIIKLGDNLAEFLNKLNLKSRGGKRGDITRLKEQMARLFSSSFTLTYSDRRFFAVEHARLVKRAALWWDNKYDRTLWESVIELDEDFFKELCKNPVPVDLRAIQVLSGSPVRLDLYTWLTYRMSTLREPVFLEWKLLKRQFGANYKRLRAFKESFQPHLLAVKAVYPEAKATLGDEGLLLSPSLPHVPKRKPPRR